MLFSFYWTFLYLEDRRYDKKHCMKRHGNFETLEKAMAACMSDTKCKGVFDEKCDNKGLFQLCTIDALLLPSPDSCIYKKY